MRIGAWTPVDTCGHLGLDSVDTCGHLKEGGVQSRLGNDRFRAHLQVSTIAVLQEVLGDEYEEQGREEVDQSEGGRQVSTTPTSTKVCKHLVDTSVDTWKGGVDTCGHLKRVSFRRAGEEIRRLRKKARVSGRAGVHEHRGVKRGCPPAGITRGLSTRGLWGAGEWRDR